LSLEVGTIGQRIFQNCGFSMITPRIALVGCGAIAEHYYLPALARHPAVIRNLILVDNDLERARQMASKFDGNSVLSDYRETLKFVDGAIVALPIHLHHPVSMDFLSQGIHVLCEKPLAESADKAAEMVEEADRTGAVLAVDYLQRLIPSFAKVKELLTEGALGKPRLLQYLVGEEFDWPTVSGFYFNSKVSARGVLRDRGAHVMDHICWWLGRKPHLLSSRIDSYGGSDAVAHVKFEHEKCHGEVKLSWLSMFPCTFVIKCEGGTVEGDVYDYAHIVLTPKSGRRKRIKLPYVTKSEIGFTLVTNFISAIRNAAKPLIVGSDVLDSVQFVDECYKAATRFDMPWYEVLEGWGGA
jgi:predicted dehydrogenase